MSPCFLSRNEAELGIRRLAVVEYCLPSASPRELLCNCTWKYRALLVVVSCAPRPIIAQHVFWNCTRKRSYYGEQCPSVLSAWRTSWSATQSDTSRGHPFLSRPLKLCRATL